MPAMQAANAPTPGTTRPSASAAAARSEVTVTSAPGPGQRPLGRAQVARPVVEHHHPRRGHPRPHVRTPEQPEHPGGGGHRGEQPPITTTVAARPGGASTPPRRPTSRPDRAAAIGRIGVHSTPLVLGTPPAGSSIADGVAQRPGDRLELGLDDVVGVGLRARAGRPQHDHVQGDAGPRGRATPRSAGSGWSGNGPAPTNGASRPAPRAPRTAGRTGRPPPAPAPRPAARARCRTGAPRPCRPAPRSSAAPRASAVSSTVWCASMCRSPSVRTVRSKPPCRPSWASMWS